MSTSTHDSSWQLTPVERGGLVGQVVHSVRQRILEGELPPGTPLPSVNELSEGLDASPAVVREALRVLSAQGLIDVAHGKRTCVKEPDPEASVNALQILAMASGATVGEFMQLRRMLEGQAARLAASRITDEELAKIEASIGKLEHAGDPEEVAEEDMLFHELIWAASGNELLRCVLLTVRGVMARMFRAAPSHAMRIRGRTADEHRMALAGLRTRDPQQAQAAMEQSLLLVEEHFQKEGFGTGAPGDADASLSTIPRSPITGAQDS
jgi:DNA-binding FadR family transcriptional regulator